MRICYITERLRAITMETREDVSSDSDHDEYEDAVEEIHINSADCPSNHCEETNSTEGKGISRKDSHQCDTQGGSGTTQADTHSVRNHAAAELSKGVKVSESDGNQDTVISDSTEEPFLDSATNVLVRQQGEVIQDTEKKCNDGDEKINSEEMRGCEMLDAKEESFSVTAECQKDKVILNVGGEEDVLGPVMEESDVKDTVERTELKTDDGVNSEHFKLLSDRLNEREAETWEGLEEEAAAEEEEDEEKEEEIFVDEEYKKEMEKDLTEEEKEARRLEAADLKSQGNEHFKKGDFTTAMQTYTQALVLCPLCYEQDRAIMYSNRAACRVKMEDNEMAVEDCTKAIELHPDYVRALLRRAQTYEVLEKLDEALADYQRVVELDRACHVARAACMRLPDEIKERNEKMKEEMMEKLKDLGNMVLRPFGLSTANFRVDQNQDSGSYNIQFVQNPNNNDE